MKEKLTTAPVLAHFNPEKPCELRTDASIQGLGAILLQDDDEGQAHPIAFISRTLTKAERNYYVSELEALTVVWAVGYLKHLIYGRKLKIVVDHHALWY